jgi:hypothetical protein
MRHNPAIGNERKPGIGQQPSGRGRLSQAGSYHGRTVCGESEYTDFDDKRRSPPV